MKHFSRLLIYNSYNVNERLLIYYKKYKCNKKHKFNTIRKNYSFRLPTMKSLNAVPLNISDTNCGPLVGVQLFQNLGGSILFVIHKKVIFLVFIYMVQFCTCISVTPCIQKCLSHHSCNRKCYDNAESLTSALYMSAVTTKPLH